MNLNLERITNPPGKEVFIQDLEEGVIHKKFKPNVGFWRISSLVGIWNKPKKLKDYLEIGKDEEFDVDTVKRFHQGTAIHDIVKKYFNDSPHFTIVEEEFMMKHSDLPITGTCDLIIEWDKYPNQQFIVEIKSSSTEFVNNPVYGARNKPFNKNRWQAGLYSTILGLPVIILYYDKNNSEMFCHFLKKEDYEKDVEKILEACRKVINDNRICDAL